MATGSKLSAAASVYCADLARVRASGGATGEMSNYGPLEKLLSAVGSTLKPKVFCVGQMADQGAGHPDFGLYAAKQVQKGKPRRGQIPEHGVVEVKPVDDDAWLTAETDQVSRYWGRYRLVLVTNLRDFLLLGEDPTGSPLKSESFRLAGSADEFLRNLDEQRGLSREVGAALGEYLVRVFSHRSTLVEPKDLAWLLASYARSGLARVEAAGGASSLATVRAALEEALGVRFQGERGDRFFNSTLVQTLFYGVFSAWVLWARDPSDSSGRFEWRTAVWHLRAPVLRALFRQLSDPSDLELFGLVEVLDQAASTLDRVDRRAFFARLVEGDAVAYFYEPFLEAFDPVLRRELGVWYTPPEVVGYMVARVDRALKEDLGIADGLAGEHVYVLDPCCGTGAFLAEVLRRIARNLASRGLGALTGPRLREISAKRVFGFEIMPAPFVVAHLQVALTMQELDAPLAADGTVRPGVYLTNALTGWEPKTTKPVPFPELEEERDRSERVKRDTPILVIVGNPPYNGYAGMAVDEERELSETYRRTRQVRRPEGQGLNDPYVRFFRMAERRIAEKTRQGVVCLISNFRWLDGLSAPGMRERCLEAFDVVRIDCLNGDSRETGKVAPDGSPDPSIFSSADDPVGIQVGTAIATLVRKANHAPAASVSFRHLWGQRKRQQLVETADTAPDDLYESFVPNLRLGLPFKPGVVSESWFDWPALPDLFPMSFPGVKTSRDRFLVDVDEHRLRTRVHEYFDQQRSHEEIRGLYPWVMKDAARYDAEAVRGALLERGAPPNEAFVRFAYRPFDNRWLYWERDTELLDRKRSDYRPHVFEGNLWLSAAQHVRKDASQPQATFSTYMGSLHLIERGANWFPAWLWDTGIGNGDEAGRRPNLSPDAQRYLNVVGASVEDLFYHVLATLHDPEYRATNAYGLRLGWPRIPLPGWPEGADRGIAAALAESASRGRDLAALLDVHSAVAGVTHGEIPPHLATIAVPATVAGHSMDARDFEVRAGWGRYDRRHAVMPGGGHFVDREYTAEERSALGDTLRFLGDTTVDVYINDNALWRSIPTEVWGYTIGGYPVLKKWLSYREYGVLGRAATPEEIQYFSETARRIAAILELLAD